MSLLRKDPVLVITGPTGSGKSSLAIKIAQQLDGEVISADSMQIYRGLDIGTAKVSLEEQAGIKHHLYDIKDPGERYSVAQFIEDANRLICEIIDRGRTPIVCGGTGLYVNALVDGLQFVEEKINLEQREQLTQTILGEGLEKYHQKLSELDPEAGERIDANDLKRIVRFFEVYENTGLTSSQVYEYSRSKGPDFNFRSYVLWPDRQFLYEKINLRTEEMFEEGIGDELILVLEKWPNFTDSQAFQAIGYKEVLPFIQGESSKTEAINHLAQATRRYAKRQFTLFRKRDDYIRLEMTDKNTQVEFILKDFEKFRQKLR